MTERTRFMLHLDSGLLRLFRGLGGLEGKPVSALIADAMRLYMEGHEKRGELTRAFCACSAEVNCTMHRRRRK